MKTKKDTRKRNEYGGLIKPWRNAVKYKGIWTPNPKTHDQDGNPLVIMTKP